MHVLQIIDSLSMGGAEMLLITFASQARLHGIKTTVIGLRDVMDSPITNSLEKLGVQIEIFPDKHLFSLPRIIKIIRFIKSEKIDLIQAHLTYGNILGALTGWFAGVPVIATLHSTREGARKANYLRNKIELLTIKYLTKWVIAVGESVADVYRSQLGNKCIEVIHNAVLPSPEFSISERKSLRNKLSIDPSHLVIIAIGRVAVSKGYGDLIDAFASVHIRYPKVSLIIIGIGDLLDKVKKQVSALQLDGVVHLLGERKDIALCLAASNIFVSASLWEGLPLAVLEAMMAGLPIVATSVGDLPKVVTPEIGLTVPPHNPKQLSEALLTLITHPEMRRKMGKAAQNKATQQFGAAAWFEKLMKLYSKVLQNAA